VKKSSRENQSVPCIKFHSCTRDGTYKLEVGLRYSEKKRYVGGGTGGVFLKIGKGKKRVELRR
jgi:hypothetical protein